MHIENICDAIRNFPARTLHSHVLLQYIICTYILFIFLSLFYSCGFFSCGPKRKMDMQTMFSTRVSR